MAKAKYESVMVVSMKQGDDGIQALISKFKSLIESHASLHSIDEWGKRRLAYLINKESEGYYVLFNFESEPEFPAELDRVYKITDGVIRSLIVRKPDGEDFAIPQKKEPVETAKQEVQEPAEKVEVQEAPAEEAAPVEEAPAEEAVEEAPAEETVEETAPAEETTVEEAAPVEEAAQTATEE